MPSVTEGRFRQFIQHVSSLAVDFGAKLAVRGFKVSGTGGQVPVKVNSTDFNWQWANVAWSTITGKPSIFPSNIANVSGLQAALDAKVSSVTVATLNGVSGAITGTAAAPIITISLGSITPSKVTTNNLNLSGLPTSSVGLVSGDVFNDSGILTVV